MDNNRDSLSLLTDFYQLTMAYGYWKAGIHEREAVYHLTFRRHPFQGGFTIAAGLENVIDFISQFHYDERDLSYLASLKGKDGSPLFSQDFLSYLRTFRFTCDVEAIPEGTVVFPHEPLIRVRGPLVQCQLLESPLLNLLNFPTLVATKAARVVLAARGDSVLEFGMRRAQGRDGALTASRSAFIGGCEATSNVMAGKIYGIPVGGTHAHSWIMAFDEEEEAFRAFAEALPGNAIFLVDTYNSIEGVKKAIQVGKELKEKGKPFLGVRLDSGDLAYLSIQTRKLLDEAGFPEAKIFASNELDEVVIAELKQQGAKIGVWGVGTKLVTAADQPSLDGVYKLSAIRGKGEKWEYKLKLSEQLIKISNPGILQVKRFFRGDEPIADVIYDEEISEPSATELIDPLDPTKERKLSESLERKDLLVPIFRKGRCVYEKPPIAAIRAYTLSNLSAFSAGIKRFLNPHQYTVGMEKRLYQKKVEIIRNIRSQWSHD